MTSFVRQAAPLVALLVLVGCGSPDAAKPSATAASSTAASEPDVSQCATVDVPMVEVAGRSAGEPSLAIPAPPGWERSTEMDSDLIRVVLVNQAIAAEGFAPNVVVTLESIPGDVSAESVFDQQRSALTTSGGATDLTSTTGTLCGQPAETTDYTGAPQGAVPARPITVLLSTLHAGGRTYGLAVTVQTLEPDNPTYIADRNTILTGFRFLPPGAAGPA